jgi:hypothetical protein
VQVRQRWAELQQEAEQVDAELEDVKFEFSHITRQQVGPRSPGGVFFVVVVEGDKG